MLKGMEFVVWIFGILLVAGVGISIYEWRKKRTLLAREIDMAAKQSAEMQRDVHNANQVFLHTPFH
jgi:hypothetical protein